MRGSLCSTLTIAQAQLTSAALDGLGDDGGRSHVDVLEENLKRQIQETEALRRDVLSKKLELEKQTAALNSLIASIHSAQHHTSSAPALADDAHTPLSDTRRSLSPIRRVPSDGDDAASPLHSLDGEESGSEGEEEVEGGGSGASSDDDSDDGRGSGRQRQRLLSIVAEVDGEDESLGEQKVGQVKSLHATQDTTHICHRSFCPCCTLEKWWLSACNPKQPSSSTSRTSCLRAQLRPVLQQRKAKWSSTQRSCRPFRSSKFRSLLLLERLWQKRQTRGGAQKR